MKIVTVMTVLSFGLLNVGAQETQGTKETSQAKFSMGSGEKNWVDVRGATRNGSMGSE